MDKPAKKSPADAALDVPANLGNPRMQWGSDVVAETIRRLDIDYIALVPGASYRGLHDSLVNYLGNRAPQMVVCLHEGHAVAIANGYAKAADKPMLAAVHSNVGLMNAASAIFSAWTDRSPMIVFGATGPVDAHKRRPWIDWIHTAKDQGALIRNYVKWDDQPASPEAAVESVLRANQIARAVPRGPVYICLDVAMQEAALAGEVAIPDIGRFAPPLPPAAPEAAVGETLRAIRAAKLPVLMLGQMSRGQEDWDARVELAEALGVAVMTAMYHPSAFPGAHPLHVLPPCGGPAQAEIDLLEKADLIVALEWNDLAGFLRTRLGDAQTQSPANFKIVRCSLDATLANGWSMDHQALPAADLSIQADSDVFVRQLLDAAKAKGAAAPKRQAVDAIVHWTERPEIEGSTDGKMRLRDVAKVVADFRKSRQVTLASLSISWPSDTSLFAGPLDYMGTDGGGTVGTGSGHTIGTALALKDDAKDADRIVLGIFGDGDFLMGNQALWTASRMRIPAMIVVTNNRSYFNDEAHQERVAVMRERPVENKWIGQRLDDPTPDLAAMARAQGFEAPDPVTTPAEFAAALERGAEIVRAGGRYFIDARIEGGYTPPDKRPLETRN